MGKKKENFLTVLEEFIQIMNLPEFQEVDRRISQLINQQVKKDTIITTEEFIYIILYEVKDFVSDDSLLKIRNTLYQNLALINELINRYKLTKGKLKTCLKSENIKELFGYLHYEVGEDFFILNLLENLKGVLKNGD